MRGRTNPDAVVLAGLDLLVHEHVLGREAAELLAVLALDGLEEHLGRAVGLLPLQHLQVAAVDQRVQRQRDLLAVDAVARELAPDARLCQALGELVAQTVQQVAQVCHSLVFFTLFSLRCCFKRGRKEERRKKNRAVRQSLNENRKTKEKMKRCRDTGT